MTKHAKSSSQQTKWSFLLLITPDIDECSDESRVCDENAACANNEGSYSCTCNEGFTGNGTTCEGTLCLF